MKKPVIIILALALLLVMALVGLNMKGRSQAADPAVTDKPDVAAASQSAPPAELPKPSEDGEAKTSTTTEEPKASPNAEAPADDATPATDAGDYFPEEDEPEERIPLEVDVAPDQPPTEVVADTAWTEWDTFLSLSPEEQDAFMQSFESPEAFAAWMVAAQAEWTAAHPTTEIGPGGVISFGK